ncbi:SDR family oxidoreductase [Halobacillus litoralis]|uniref:SDR family oxidoreductase n=1 Tax=Halobacillus litoralis TaxID=45668 RepID=UPI001CFE6AD8|nr:SDR family oxidoreductase [Halobacillus litoralis]
MTYSQPKIALVTGVGNHKGIGAAVCRKLASQGISIFFTYWKSETGFANRFKREISERGVLCEGLEVDLSTNNAYKTLIKEVCEQLGCPTILINNAAHSIDSNYTDLDGKTLDDHYNVNVKTTFMLCVEFARLIEKNEMKKGRIVNLTSGQGKGPMPGNLAYAATKGAISSFTESLSSEVAELGITVNAVNPGPTDSNWMTDEIREYLLPKFKMGRIGKPEDAANLIGFLCSDDAQWVTGQVIHSEGGFLRS